MSYNEGLEKGQNDSKLEIAKKMLSRGDDINDIIDVTNLSKDEILNLK